MTIHNYAKRSICSWRQKANGWYLDLSAFFMLCWSNPFSTFSKWVCQITSKLSGDETDLNTLSSSQKRTFALSLAKVLSAADRGLS